MITPEEIEHWRHTWFTTQNAVLWVAGEIPAGLRLPLPSGQRWAVPAPTSALPQTPAFFASERNVVAMDAVIRRVPAAGGLRGGGGAQRLPGLPPGRGVVSSGAA